MTKGRLFVIEDDLHAEILGRYATRTEAVAALLEWEARPWDDRPNRAPCTSWKTCGREYVLIEVDTSGGRWREIDRKPALNVSAAAVEWLL